MSSNTWYHTIDDTDDNIQQNDEAHPSPWSPMALYTHGLRMEELEMPIISPQDLHINASNTNLNGAPQPVTPALPSGSAMELDQEGVDYISDAIAGAEAPSETKTEKHADDESKSTSSDPKEEAKTEPFVPQTPKSPWEKLKFNCGPEYSIEPNGHLTEGELNNPIVGTVRQRMIACLFLINNGGRYRKNNPQVEIFPSFHYKGIRLMEYFRYKREGIEAKDALPSIKETTLAKYPKLMKYQCVPSPLRRVLMYIETEGGEEEEKGSH